MKVEQSPSTSLTGKEFEDLVVYRLTQIRELGFGSFCRPGVHAIPQQRFDDGTVRARLIASLPDFQGVFDQPQREAVFDAKVCSKPSFDLDKYRSETKGARARQLRFMYERSQFGSLCFFLIHWNERKLKTKQDPAMTYAFPVIADHPFWRMFEIGEERNITRAQCEEYGVECTWSTIGREKTAKPDLAALLKRMNGVDLRI